MQSSRKGHGLLPVAVVLVMSPIIALLADRAGVCRADGASGSIPVRERNVSTAGVGEMIDQVACPAGMLAGRVCTANGRTANDRFRDAVARFARQIAAGAASPECPETPVFSMSWSIDVTVHHGAIAAGRGRASRSELCPALRAATTRAVEQSGLSVAAVADAQLQIDFAGRDFSLIERDGLGHELSHGVVAVRELSAELVRDRIQAGKEYLFRMFEPERGGVHKYYHATDDRLEERLHTIYTASAIFTLFKLRAIDDDPRIDQQIEQASEFLLGMQSLEEGDRSHGGFYYSHDLDRGEREGPLVTGTTSKTIFTLLLLHENARDSDDADRYMAAARRAADWLTTMQNQDGSVKSWMKWREDGWVYTGKKSLLYTGQVVSALSRMYRATGDSRYLDAADLGARYLAHQVATRGCYLGDDYRDKNPISSSWVILSLFDFYRATGQRRAWDLVNRCADGLLDRQLGNRRDVYRHGRWRRSLSSSGNGWLDEVISEIHLHCRENHMTRCERFEEAIIPVTRLLMQYTYTRESAFVVKNPSMALGGVFWNARERHVRTDSVCHAMNAYINILPLLDERGPYWLHERSLQERLRQRGEISAPGPRTPGSRGRP